MSQEIAFGEPIPAYQCMELAPDLYLNACFAALTYTDRRYAFVLERITLFEDGKVKIRLRVGKPGSSQLREVCEIESKLRRYDFSKMDYTSDPNALLARLNANAEKAREAEKSLRTLANMFPRGTPRQ